MKRLSAILFFLVGTFAFSETLYLNCTGTLDGTDSYIQFVIDDAKFADYFGMLQNSHPEYDLSPYHSVILAYSGPRGIGMLVTKGDFGKLLDGSESQLWVTATSADDAEFLTAMSFMVKKIDDDTYSLDTYWNEIADDDKEVRMEPMGTMTGKVVRQ
jgi:hypothetical protein